MGVVIPFLRPGMVSVTYEQRARLLELAHEMRQLQIAHEGAIAKGKRIPQIARTSTRCSTQLTEIVLACFSAECAAAKQALILYGQLEYLDTEAIAGERAMLEAIDRMRRDLDRVLERMFLWSTVTPQDQCTIKTIEAHFPRIQSMIKSCVISSFAS